MKKIYVGIILSDYATPLCMGLDKQKVEEKMKSYDLERSWWIEEYNLNENNVIELDG
jgi:hypothetical protein